MGNQPTLSMKEQFMTVPNLLSMLRLALVPVFLYLLLTEKYLSAIVVLALSSLTDYLDGYFARKFNQVTRLGQLLDPAADRLYIFHSRGP
jgi:cardiolipin synthase